MKSNIKPQEVEVINAGKRLVRTNIVPHYLPVDESKITTVEVPNSDGGGTHTETIYPELIVEYWTYDERIEYQTCYALLSFSEYFRLNMQISEADSYVIGASTERYTTMSPKTAKVNIQEDGSYDAALIFEVTAEVQRKYPELLVGIELVDSYERIEGGVTELLVTGLDPDVIDWTLLHYIRVGAKEDNMVLKVDPALLSVLPENVGTTLDSLGITIQEI